MNPLVAFAGFFIHTVVGTAIFALLFSVAAALNLAIGYLHTMGVNWFICGMVQFTEYSIVVVDVLLYLFFLIVTSLHLGGTLVGHKRS